MRNGLASIEAPDRQRRKRRNAYTGFAAGRSYTDPLSQV